MNPAAIKPLRPIRPAKTKTRNDKNFPSELYRNLISQLRQFGLNPLHWQIEKNKKLSDKVFNVELRHLSDSNYRLNGTAEILAPWNDYKRQPYQHHSSVLWREIHGSFNF